MPTKNLIWTAVHEPNVRADEWRRKVGQVANLRRVANPPSRRRVPALPGPAVACIAASEGCLERLRRNPTQHVPSRFFLDRV